MIRLAISATALTLASLAACSMQPAHADAWTPGQQITDTGRLARPTARPLPLPPKAPVVSYRVDAEGTRYTAQDVRLGFLPVITGYRRSGGGLVRAWGGAPAGFLVAGLDTPATITRLMDDLPDPPSPPQPPLRPEPPSPHDPPQPPITAVPGPLPLLILPAVWLWARRLRRRVG